MDRFPLSKKEIEDEINKLTGDLSILRDAIDTLSAKLLLMNKAIESKQESSTAITTSNISKQSVNHAKSADAAVDQTARNHASKIGSGNNVGGIYKYRDNKHEFGFSYVNLNYNTVPQILIDNDLYSLIPNNKSTTSNNKIVDMYIDYTVIPWKLVIKVYIDGTIYTDRITFNNENEQG